VRASPEVQAAYLGGHEMSGNDLILDARDIHAWYGSSHVLHGVALQIAAARPWACWAATAWARAR
jgi:hypothetical protein